MNVIYYCEALVPNVKENIAFLSRNCFPPAVNGDWEEVDKTLKRLDELLIKRFDHLDRFIEVFLIFCLFQTRTVFSRDQGEL